MKRRDFIKTGALLAGALSLPSIAKSFTPAELVTGSSLAIITNDADAAAALAQSFFAKTGASGRLKYEEFDLTGEFLGDIVFVDKGKLVNFRSEHDRKSGLLAEISSKLDLPAKLTNPKFVRFLSVADTSNDIKSIRIFSNNSLVKEIKLNNELVTFSVEGAQGTSEFQLSKAGIKVVGAPCGHKTCMKLGTASIAGESLVCIPNRVRAVVYGAQSSLFDAISH